MVLLLSSIIGAFVVFGVVAAVWAIGDARYFYRLACQRTSDQKHPLRIGTYGRLRRGAALLVANGLLCLMLMLRLYADPFTMQYPHEWFRVLLFAGVVAVIDLILLWESLDQRAMDPWFWTHDPKSASKPLEVE